MDDVVVMHELDGEADLPYDCANPLLTQTPLFLEATIDIPAAAKLHHQIEMVLV